MITDAQAAAADEFWHVDAADESACVLKPFAVARRRSPTIYGEPETGWSIPVWICDAHNKPYSGRDFTITNVENVVNGLNNAHWCVPEVWAAERHLFTGV